MKPHCPILILWFNFFLIGCIGESNTPDIPSYLHIEPFILETNQPQQGSSSSKIQGTWVFIDDEFIGYYKLPNSIPVLNNGDAEIKLSAGIHENGISTRPIIYPFYTPYIQRLNLDPKMEFNLNPNISYLPQTKFALIENFESTFSVLSEIISGNAENRIQNQKEMVFEGNQSGKIELSTEHPSVEIAAGFRWPKTTFTNTSVFIELNYKSDVPGVFGLIGYPSANSSDGIKVYRYGFNPSKEWNKIYFNLADLLNTSNFESYRLIFKTELNASEKNKAFVYLDNLKVVHF
jgi:hypothetical protein